MVPLGPMAFVPGELVHTNELMVLLGDNYFAERSSAQAAEIMQRRVGVIDDIIRRTEKKVEDLAARDAFSHEARQVVVHVGFQKRERDTERSKSISVTIVAKVQRFSHGEMGHGRSCGCLLSNPSFCCLCPRPKAFSPPDSMANPCLRSLLFSLNLHAGARKALLAKMGAGEGVTTAPPAAREVEERADEDDDEGLVNTFTFSATCSRGS